MSDCMSLVIGSLAEDLKCVCLVVCLSLVIIFYDEGYIIYVFVCV